MVDAGSVLANGVCPALVNMISEDILALATLSMHGLIVCSCIEISSLKGNELCRPLSPKRTQTMVRQLGGTVRTERARRSEF